MVTTKHTNSEVSPHSNGSGEISADRYFAKAIGKAFHILEIFRKSPEPLSLMQVSEEIRSAKSSVFRIIHTLEALGYLREAGGDRFTLSPTIAYLVPNNLLSKLFRSAEPHMKDLGREFRETVSLAFLFQNHIEVVQVIESPQKVQMGNIVGGIIPPHASSLGKSIIAGQSEERREKLLRTYGIYSLTPHTLIDEVELKKELDQIRSRGYATDMEESTLGGCCFGAAVVASGNCPIAAVSVSVPKMRLEDPEKYISGVCATAKMISNDLKHS